MTTLRDLPYYQYYASNKHFLASSPRYMYTSVYKTVLTTRYTLCISTIPQSSHPIFSSFLLVSSSLRYLLALTLRREHLECSIHPCAYLASFSLSSARANSDSRSDSESRYPECCATWNVIRIVSFSTVPTHSVVVLCMTMMQLLLVSSLLRNVPNS